MKKIILAGAMSILGLGLFAQTDSMTPKTGMGMDKKHDDNQKREANKAYNKDKTEYKPNQTMNMKEGECTFKLVNGKVMKMMDGKTVALDKTMTTKNGTTVMTDGTMKTKEGKTMKMKEGECMDMSGKMIEAKNTTPVEKEPNRNY